MNNIQSFISCGKKNVWELYIVRLALKQTKSLCIPHEFNTVLTVLISKPTKYFTVPRDEKYMIMCKILQIGLANFFLQQIKKVM